MRLLLLAVTTAIFTSCVGGCGVFVHPGDNCSEPGELVCGDKGEQVATDVMVLLCEGKTYTRAGNCPQSCDHVTGVRTSVGCGDKTIRAVMDSRCDSNGGACSMDQKNVMNCTNGTWQPISACIGKCIMKPSGLLGCE
jgi:NifU-like protein involved in Fe-S cluster formation